jgi:hypothetical protein
MVHHCQAARFVPTCGSVVGAQLDARSDGPGALAEEVAVGQADELTRQLASSDREA